MLHSIKNEEKDKKKPAKIKLYVTQKETWPKSVLNDVTSILILTGLVWVNEATLHSAFLNFLFGIMGLGMLIGWVIGDYNKDIIKGTDVEEIIVKLRKRLTETE